MKSKLFAVALTVSIAMLFGLGLTYLYGQLFQHDRYWEGTIVRVEQTQSKLIESFVTRTSFANFDKKDFSNLFSSLDGKMLVEIYDDNQPLYSNAPRWEVNTKNEVIAYTLDGMEVRWHTFQAPTWNTMFLSWLSYPRQWFTYKYDYITVPFVTFSLIIFLFLSLGSALLVNRYLQNDVLRSLQMLEGKRNGV